MTVVVDASVAIRWLFPVSRRTGADDLIRSGGPLIAPDLIVAEITNAAWKFVEFEGLPRAAATTILAATARGFDELVPSATLTERALQIAIDLHHPAYDCFYLSLAEARQCQMVTADDRLRSRCAKTKYAKLIRPLTAP